MATYANATTNPFIKPNNNESTKGNCSNNNKEIASTTKNAPGMARLQSKRERKRAKRRQQENLLLDVAGEESTDVALEQPDDTMATSDIESSKESGEIHSSKVVDGNDNFLIKDSYCSGDSDEQTQLATKSPTIKNETCLEEISEPIDLTREDQVVIDLTEISLNSPTKLANGHAKPAEEAEPVESNEQDADAKSQHEKQNIEIHSNENESLASVKEEDEEEDVVGECDQAHEEAADEEELAPMERDSRRHQHIELIKKLRLQLRDLERYAYERGELDQVPASMMAERQTVILDSLKRKLPLNIDKNHMEKLELEELKSQVDKEISELIDPLITKDHQLNQLKTQLTDLERYVSHLHKTLGRRYEKGEPLAGGDCSCKIHGCSTPSHLTASMTFQSLAENDQQSEQTESTIVDNETLPKTSRLIRGLMAQLICSDMKIQEAMKMDKDYSRYPGKAVPCHERKSSQDSDCMRPSATTKAPQFHDTAVWNMHIDRVLLATDSLTNLFNIEPATTNSQAKNVKRKSEPAQVDESLVDSIVRRQLIPALRDLLAYGLIDPTTLPRPTYRSLLFDPYNLITALTCLPGSQSQQQDTTASLASQDKIHVWDVIEDYFNSHNEPNFQNSSVKTLSQSFNLTPSMEGPIKVTSKQSLMITLDDIIERLARCKPNGPESHFKLFVYSALNHAKLATWIRIVFRNKMDKFLQVIDALNQIEFKLNTDTGTTDQFVSVF